MKSFNNFVNIYAQLYNVYKLSCDVMDEFTLFAFNRMINNIEFVKRCIIYSYKIYVLTDKILKIVKFMI